MKKHLITFLSALIAILMFAGCELTLTGETLPAETTLADPGTSAVTGDNPDTGAEPSVSSGDASSSDPETQGPPDTAEATTSPAVTSSPETTATVTEPAETQPAVTEPAVTEPSVNEPSVTEPAGTEPEVTGPSEPGSETDKAAYYEGYLASADFGYAGEAKDLDIISESMSMHYVVSDFSIDFDGGASGARITACEKDNNFYLILTTPGENGSLVTEYYRSEKKEGESFDDFIGAMGFDEIGVLDKDEMTACRYVGQVSFEGSELDGIEITLTEKAYDENGNPTGETMSMPVEAYVDPVTLKIVRIYMTEEYREYDENGAVMTGENGAEVIHRNELTVKYLPDYSLPLPGGVIFSSVTTEDLILSYQMALLLVLLGA